MQSAVEKMGGDITFTQIIRCFCLRAPQKVIIASRPDLGPLILSRVAVCASPSISAVASLISIYLTGGGPEREVN